MVEITLLAILGIVAAAYLLAAPAVAIVVASDASRRARSLEAKIRELEAELASRMGVASPFRVPAGVESAPPPRHEPASAPRVAPAAPSSPRNEAPVEDREPPAPEPAAPEPPAATLEESIALSWLTRVGAVAFVLGGLFFFKYAVESEWVGARGRIAIGALVGAGLLGAAELMRRRVRPRFVQALVGIGLSTWYVTVWASVTFYAMVPAALAFATNTAVTLLGVALALRHRGVSILVLALLAAFANPVVLSTGANRPFELFSYLLLVTSAAGFSALRMRRIAGPEGARWAPRSSAVAWLAMVGTAALFAGWYAQHGSSGGVEIPALMLELFAAQWTAFAVLSGPSRAARSQAAVGLVLAHAGLGVLLHDTPAALLGCSLPLAVAALFAAKRLDEPTLAAIPTAVSALVLTAAISSSNAAPSVALAGLLLVSAAVLAAGSLWLHERRGRGPVVASGVALLAHAVVACRLFYGVLPWAYALALAAASAAVVWTAPRAEPRIPRAPVALLSAIALGVGAGGTSFAARPWFLVASVVWSLALVGPSLLRRSTEQDPSWDALLTAAVASLGLLGATVVCTSPADAWVRAGVAACTGVADFALALWLFQQRPANRDPLSLLGGLGLALFAASVAFATDGATLTVLWAALAAIAAVTAARTEDGRWLILSGALFVGTVVRALVVDVPFALAETERFLASTGAQGRLLPLLFGNEGFVALIGAGAGLLVAARSLWSSPPAARRFARVVAPAGYAALLLALVFEARSAALSPPAPPARPFDAAAWDGFVTAFDAAVRAAEGSRSMVTTLVLALGAAALLTSGFSFRSAFHRYLGLGVFAVAVGKLAVWDVWRVGRVGQVVLLTGVGALLVAGGFLYARASQRAKPPA
jgi:uncharacterized membrane protein